MPRLAPLVGTLVLAATAVLVGAAPLQADETPHARLLIGFPPPCGDPDAATLSALECLEREAVDAVGRRAGGGGRRSPHRPCRDGARRRGRAGRAPAQLSTPRRGGLLHRLGLEPTCTNPGGRSVSLRGLLHLAARARGEQDHPTARPGVAHPRARPAVPCDGRSAPDGLAVLGRRQPQNVARRR